jgi:hypothetical protein
MFGYCCKCQDGNAGYSGRSGSGGGLYFNPYGVGGGCPSVCSTVPYAWDATITSAGGCPCAGYGGTVQLQHVAGPYTYGTNYFSGGLGAGAPCDVWASSERALNSATCVAQTFPRYEVLLWGNGPNFNWFGTWMWLIGFAIRTTRTTLGPAETGATCFDNKSSIGIIQSDGIPACVFTNYTITAA